MNQLILANELLNYISALQKDQNINAWICRGKTDITYGSPNGGWNGMNGFLFVKNDESYSFVIRSIPKKDTASYIVIESLNLKGQLYNMDLSNRRICKEKQGQTYLLESYRMTVGKGKKKEKDVENGFKSFNVNTNEVTVIDDLNPNWSKTLTDILEWAILREKVKVLLKKNNKKVFKVNYKEAYSNWLDTKVPTTSGSKSSYIRSIDLLSETIGYPIFEENNIEKLNLLYNDLIVEQRVESGKYWNEKSSSYGLKGFYSAAINSYSDFLKDYLSNKTTMETSYFNSPLNQILYGPPGTGKTYNTINKAIAIANPDFDLLQSRDLIKIEYERLVETGQIVFTTFHQSMSYEDFIEGIKPESKENNLIYDIVPGLFLEICNTAENNWEDAKEGNIEKLSFEDAFLLLKEELIENEKIKFPLKREGSDFTIIGFTKKSIQFKKASGGTGHTLSIGTLKDYYYKKRKVRLTGVGIYYPSILDKLNKYQPIIISEKAVKNYVIIIDEINRGNVSQIFGELITLIEENKRLGTEEALEVILPYSKEKFGVPPNLFIIGTMNTADRSVEALDAALRRRFCFEEMPPLYDLDGLQNDIFGYQASKILNTINSRIEKLIDKDHAIGHSYLLNKDKDSIVDSFYKNIIPLLQEYFFGDYGKLGLVLGKGFVHLKESDKGADTFADFDDDASNDFDNRNVYEIIDYRKVKDHKIGIIEMTFDKALKVLMKGNLA